MVKKTSSLFLLMGRREIKKRWPQFLAIIAMGAIAVTLFVGLQSNATSLESRANECYEKGALPDVWVTTSSFDDEDRANIQKEVGFDSVIDQRYYSSFLVDGKTIFASVSPTLPILSKPYELASGSTMNEDEEYFVLDEALLKTGSLGSLSYGIGDVINCSFDLLSLGTASFSSSMATYLKDGKSDILSSNKIILPLTVTGGMKHPENTSKSSYGSSTALLSSISFRNSWAKVLGENYTESGVDFFFEHFFKEKLGWGDGKKEGEVRHFPVSNQYLVSCGGKSLTDTENSIKSYFSSKDKSNLYAIQDRKSQSYTVTLQNDIDQAKSFCYVFPFVFFFTALLVILTTLSQMILQDRTSIGTLKALGVKKSGIFAYYSFISLSLVGLGTLIGEVLGPLIIPSIMDAKYSILYVIPASTYLFPVLPGVLTALVFLLSAVLVTLLVSFKEVRLKPAESMRPSSPHLHLPTAQKTRKRKGTPLSLSFKMGIRNIVINPLKSFMVVAGVAGCAALLCCGFGIDDTVNYGIDHDIEMASSSDIEVGFLTNLDETTSGYILNSVSGVDDFELYSRGKSSIRNPSSGLEIDKNYFVLSGGNDSHFKVFDFSDEECSISEKVASSLSLRVGDNVSFDLPSGSYSLKVGSIYKTFSYHGIVLRTTNKLVFPELSSVKYNAAYVDVDNTHTVKEVADKLKSSAGVSSALTHDERLTQIQDLVSGIKVMTIAVKVFAILLALVVLYNLALLNFSSRTRDIATLKVLGFSKREISLSLLVESLTLTLLGVGIGMALGQPFLRAVMGTNVVELVSYLYTIYPLSYVFSFLLTFVVALLVDIFLNFRIKNVKMVESLKSVE